MFDRYRSTQHPNIHAILSMFSLIILSWSLRCSLNLKWNTHIWDEEVSSPSKQLTSISLYNPSTQKKTQTNTSLKAFMDLFDISHDFSSLWRIIQSQPWNQLIKYPWKLISVVRPISWDNYCGRKSWKCEGIRTQLMLRMIIKIYSKTFPYSLLAVSSVEDEFLGTICIALS